MKNKVVLVVMDGVGISENDFGNAVKNASTPNLDKLMNNYPYTLINAHGTFVGMPSDSDMGNSEVGHMNLGAGRIVYQDLAKINLAVANNTLAKEPVLIDAFTYAKENLDYSKLAKRLTN